MVEVNLKHKNRFLILHLSPLKKGLVVVPIAVRRLGEQKVKRSRGRVARLGSAKAPTAVRIRSRPQNDKTPSVKTLGVFQFN